MVWIVLTCFAVLVITIAIALTLDASKTDRWLDKRAEDYDKEIGG